MGLLESASRVSDSLEGEWRSVSGSGYPRVGEGLYVMGADGAPVSAVWDGRVFAGRDGAAVPFVVEKWSYRSEWL